MALRDQHAGQPMTDAELAQYRFGPNVPDALDIARMLTTELEDWLAVTPDAPAREVQRTPC